MTNAGFVSWTRQQEQPGQKDEFASTEHTKRDVEYQNTVHCILYTRSTPGDRPTHKDHFRRTIISDSRMFQNQECTFSIKLYRMLGWLYEYVWGWVVACGSFLSSESISRRARPIPSLTPNATGTFGTARD